MADCEPQTLAFRVLHTKWTTSGPTVNFTDTVSVFPPMISLKVVRQNRGDSSIGLLDHGS
jgi:hypothetical protein